jgi:glycosyltransferase involved in cell wall biosynthesis
VKKIAVLLKGNINFDSRVQKEIKTLQKIGFTVTLLVWNWEKISCELNDVKIVEVNLSNHAVPKGALLTFLKILLFWFKTARYIRSLDFEYIHCNDLDTLGVIFFLPRSFRSKIVYDAHELFPEHHARDRVKYYIWNRLEQYLITKASHVIVPELNRGEYIKKKYGLKSILHVINNFPEYTEVEALDIRSKLNLAGKKIVCFHGVIQPDRYIEHLIEAMRLLSEEYVLILIGYAYGSYLSVLKEQGKRLGVEKRIIFYGKVAAKEIVSVIGQADVGVALYRNDGINNFFCAPNKVFDYLMAGVKVVTNDYPSLQMLKNLGCAELVKDCDPPAIAGAVEKLASNDFIISREIKSKFSWESFDNLFKEIYC